MAFAGKGIRKSTNGYSSRVSYYQAKRCDAYSDAPHGTLPRAVCG